MKATTLIKETVDFYSKNPRESRSLDESGKCLYNSEDGTHCAVGRCLLSKYKKKKDGEFNQKRVVYLPGYLEAKSIDDVLLSKYRGHNIFFWKDLQNLHDMESHWTPEGLSIYGKKVVEELLEKYK